ncbi:MAG: hypothetical protein QXI27_02070 [Nitrososphaerota archaeon]
MSRTSEAQKTDIRRLEDEIRELREPIEKTIMDVRELIAEIDNAAITSPNVEKSRPTVKKPVKTISDTNNAQEGRLEQSAAQAYQRPGNRTNNAESMSAASAYLDLNLYAVTSFTLRLLGYQNLERILQSIRTGVENVDWLKRQVREVAEIILRGSRLEGSGEKYPFPGSDAYLLGFYLLSLFLQRPGDPNIGLLVIALSRILLGESLVR